VAYNLTISDGSCGYGLMDGHMFPFYNIAGVSANSPLMAFRGLQACGTCLEVQCTDTREVRPIVI
jgi:hypothetical protein